MNIYHLTQDDRKDYDTYSDCVVVAKDAPAASKIHPGGYELEHGRWSSGAWAATPDRVTVTLLGVAVEGIKPGVVCYSFHAG